MQGVFDANLGQNVISQLQKLLAGCSLQQVNICRWTETNMGRDSQRSFWFESVQSAVHQYMKLAQSCMVTVLWLTLSCLAYLFRDSCSFSQCFTSSLVHVTTGLVAKSGTDLLLPILN